MKDPSDHSGHPMPQEGPAKAILPSFIHPFIQQVLIDHLLYARIDAGHRRCSSEQDQGPPQSVVGRETTTHKINQLCREVGSDTCCGGRQWVRGLRAYVLVRCLLSLLECKLPGGRDLTGLVGSSQGTDSERKKGARGRNRGQEEGNFLSSRSRG